ncbi:MAG: hypothetical protein JXR76_10435 [Deltaproteobacteria bacterium]|nr:hypothetical protein [Deltaproteobacteria bacterium]
MKHPLFTKIIPPIVAFMSIGCWDNPAHELDTPINTIDTATDSDSDTALQDSASDTTTLKRNSLLAEDWTGFGDACTADTDCTAYPSEHKRCIQDVMSLVNSPGGYCTACCNTPGVDVCGPNVDCVGAANAFLICLARCETDADCRTEDNYECHQGLYYMETIFTGKYCLPNAAHITPDTDNVQQTTCPWPWL